MPLRGVLLDIDGTLVNSNDLHAQAWVDALRHHGFDVPFEQVRRLIGMGGDHLLPPGGIGQQPGHHRDPSRMDTVLRLLNSHEALVEGIGCHCTEAQQT